ncbi:amidohydrolase family protein [Steroidobacter flavus]|uniref:Amidohydrolase family protein n=1 Tax=Steroidobacter flavus TaxID=1842136 RepID=A0ABV8T5B3_9GAMM
MASATMRACWLAAAISAACAGSPAFAKEQSDLIIVNGTVHDGSDAASRVGDVVIRGDRIVYVGSKAQEKFSAGKIIDATGKIVAPGFIDPHTHPDEFIRSNDPTQRLTAAWLFQGATTLMIGVDGAGTPDLDAEDARIKKDGVGLNLGAYVGFGRIRQSVLEQDARAPTAQELQRMQSMVADGMCQGAFGLSTGLFYAPQSFAKTEEVIAVAREAATRGGIYDTHQRDESSYSIGLLGSTREVLRIGREAGLPVHFAHIKALGVDVHGEADDVIKLINEARAAGQVVTADQYPWLASGTGLSASLLPRWAVDGGRPALLKRLDNNATLQKIRTEMRENLRRRGGPDSLVLTVASSPWHGKKLGELARERGEEPIDAALFVIRDGRDAAVSFNMDNDDVIRFMHQPWVVTSSDGSSGHPRQFATFPQKYREYVQKGVITLGEFIRSSTGRTADLLSLKARGYLREGYFADVLVFDPKRYAPKADYLHPRELSEGVTQLLVNGQLAIDGGKLTGIAAGKLLRHEAKGSCPQKVSSLVN